MIKNKILISPLLFFVLACTSTAIKVDSNPEKAEVFLQSGKKIKKIGETPLKINKDELSDFDQYNLSIKKEGYLSQSFLIENRLITSQMEVYADLVKMEQAHATTSLDSIGKNQQSRIVASVQSLMFKQDFSQAENVLKNYLSASPDSAIGWNLLGNACLMQNKNREALAAYKKALSYDPENSDTLRIIEFLNNSPQRKDR